LPNTLMTTLGKVRLRLQLLVIARALAIGGAVFAVMLMVDAAGPTGRLKAASIAAVVVALVIGRYWRVSIAGVAREIENREGTLDNLVITAAELSVQPRPVQAEIRDAIFTQAEARIATVDPGRVVPLMQPVGVAAAVLLGCALLASVVPRTGLGVAGTVDGTNEAPAAGVISVRITPPAYTARPIETLTDPVQVTTIAGSRVRIESGARVLREWVAVESASLELRAENLAPRFLSVIVIPDTPPVVRINEPGRDTALATGTGTLTIGLDGRDDLGLASLALRFTKVSGGGENVTFTEGAIPIAIERVSDREWRGRARWPLDGLGLAEGDVLVYRAVARDANPAGAPVQSDAFLVEIGRSSEIVGAGFALPTEERKYAISQQMVIYKTEQLIASVGTSLPSRSLGGKSLPGRSLGEGWLEQTRMIGMEQRMVRAEVVFLSGGEVEDEVEEAAHSDELAEGRLENRGRAEMVRAINFMSRAEAQLNDGRAAEALVFERQALASLERALDRRRYFLRTLPDRSRIDTTRRLTADRREARSWVRDRAARAAPSAIERQREVMRELASAAARTPAVDASLAARVAAIDPSSPELQKAAVGIATARSLEERSGAIHAAMQAVTAHALRTLPAAAVVTMPADPLTGRLADTRKNR
jgi:hypothetical protein